MQTIRQLMINLLGCLLLGAYGASAAAGDTRSAGTVNEVMAAQQQIVVNRHYYRLDKRVVIHGPVENQLLSVDDLIPGTPVGLRVSEPSKDSLLPIVEEIWVYTD